MRRAAAYDGSATPPLVALALAQHAIVTTRQLRALQVSESRITRLLAAGWLVRLHRGVYAVGGARLTAKGLWMASVRACGDGCRLSHGDALALYDLWRVGSGAVHVSAAGTHRVAGVRCHVVRDVARLGDTVIDGIPVTSLERAVLDCAPTLSRQRLRSLLEEIERRDRFDLRRFATELRRSNGHRGVGRVRTAIAEMSDSAPALRSGMERRLLEGARAAGLPEPGVNVEVDGELVDLHWARWNVIVELDSWAYHRGRRSFSDDRRRGNVAALAGRTLLRFTDDQVVGDLDGVIAEIRAALHARGWRP